jgi:hypothetical protein
MPPLDEDFLVCSDDRCVLMADDFKEGEPDDSTLGRFNSVIADILKVYPDAVLAGAVAAAKYVRDPEIPRQTLDVDILLGEKDFAEFLVDEIPEDKLKALEAGFDTSDSVNHSLKHRKTGIFVDLMSTESKPLRNSIIREAFENRDHATHLLIGENHAIDILKPELLLAMKIIRYCKNPKNEKGMSDRQDIIKILKTMAAKKIPVDHEKVCSFLRDFEIKKYKVLMESSIGKGLDGE